MTMPASVEPSRVHGTAEDNDSDSISLTSTLDTQHDSEEEWNVEGILAERFNEQRQYREFLIEWTGYPMREWTWEPEHGISLELDAAWQKSRKRQEDGLEPPFDLAEYDRAVADFEQDKLDRHRRRNFKRAKLGQDIHLREDERESDYYDSTDGNSEEDESNDVLPSPKPVDTGVSTDPPRPKAATKDNAAKSKQATINLPKLQTKKKQPPAAPPHPPSRPQGQPQIPPISTSGYQGTARKPSLQSPTKTLQGHSVPQPASTGSSKPTFTAKKKSTATKATVTSKSSNIFIAGKKRKKRASLGESMVDVTKDPKLFNKRRTLRQAELSSREKADMVPPDPSRIQLFNISNGPTAIFSGASHATEKADERSPLDRRPSLDSENRSYSMRSADSVDSGQEQVKRSKKKKKVVQFAATPMVEEPMEIDEGTAITECSTTVQDPTHPPLTRISAVAAADNPHSDVSGISSSSNRTAMASGALRRLSLADYQSRSVGQSIDKTIVLGPRDSKQVQVTFDGISRDPEPWQSLFLSQESLIFDHVCIAQTFENQANNIKGPTLSHGSITSKSDEPALERVAEQLRMGPFGLFFSSEEYCILIYPTKCEDWKQKLTEAEPASPADVALRHVIFRANPAARPLAIPDPSSMNPSEVTATAQTVVLERLLGLDYTHLLPTRLRGLGNKHHSFFLAFPSSKLRIFNLVAKWLRERSPECTIYTSQGSGDWLAFTKSVESGTVIIHEDVTWSIRRFPGILKLLLARNTSFAFWSFGESLQAHPMLPSIQSLHHVADPGSIELTRLFPHGNAILVTPSFLVSQPRRAREFLGWFKRNFHLPSSFLKVAACHGLEDYLLEIANKKASERQSLMVRRGHWLPSELEDEATALGLGKEDCAARFDSWMLVKDLVCMNNLWDSSGADEDQQHMVFASECIDANDEQSLVNWFGWWSTTKLDCFRKFHVLGSHENDSRKASLKVPIPVFSKETVNDPEVALEELDREIEAQDAAQLARVGVGKEDSSKQASLVAQSKSEILRQDRPTAEVFRTYLWSLAKNKGIMGKFLHLYGIPVSYFLDAIKMAENFGDLRFGFETVKSWFAHPYAFSSGKFNTYIGVFYTIDGVWDPEVSTQKRQPLRHPWLAIYRPVNPHILPFRATELIIWDIEARNRFPNNKQPYVRDLIHAQRHVIEYVQEHGSVKNPRLPLKQVWLGGFQPPPTEYTSPLDQTLVALEEMLGNTRQWLPAGDIMMPARGFRLVNLSSSGNQSERSETTDPMSIDSPDNSEAVPGEDDVKILFHPPRGTGRATRHSKCKNRFYEEAVKLRAMDKKRSEFVYDFEPTLEWYIRQKAEGRAFEHINVDTWEPIFKILNINLGANNP